MTANNRLWGAERIRGELLKPDIRVSKRTIQKYMKQIRPKRAHGQNWRTFLRNHAAEVSGVGACDFLQIPDLFFRPLFAFFLIELKSRKVIHEALSCMFTVDRKSCSRFTAQLYLFHKRKVRGEERKLVLMKTALLRTDVPSSQHNLGIA
jgi:hypothetical protein